MSEQASPRLRSSARRRDGRRRAAVTAAVAVAVGVMTAGVLAPTAALASARPDGVQQGLNVLVRDDGVPAVLASVTDRGGRARNYTAGVADPATGAKVPVDGQVRIGSNTKVFTAVVVLQLVGEGKIGLDTPVDTYLPGLVRGDGIDGRNITVRQLLQHTSGLPEYLASPQLSDITAAQHRYFEPRDLIDMALAQKAEFAPGTKWAYNNTGYVLAGLIVQKVTGRPIGEEITRRVIDRIGLRHTYFPAPGDQGIREPHPQGYYRTDAGAPLRDFTEMDPSWTWAAGQMISTDSDLNRFYGALLGGDLLPEAQLAQMRTTVPTTELGPGISYGLGLASMPLPCGDGVYWGHSGGIPGYKTRAGATEGGRRAASVAATVESSDAAVAKHLDSVMTTALCR
ncbi:serine hydrolase domain-containing protein [Kitasatospora sp. NPDC050463]|uniref:serine hydrolase domain-containing protein n=1 Tax=Kitasatospora sp. NPDC050463 TaxID=3155786 RepID=UPI0033F80517